MIFIYDLLRPNKSYFIKFEATCLRLYVFNTLLFVSSFGKEERETQFMSLSYIAHELWPCKLSKVIEWHSQHTMDINNYERS